MLGNLGVCLLFIYTNNLENGVLYTNNLETRLYIFMQTASKTTYENNFKEHMLFLLKQGCYLDGKLSKSMFFRTKMLRSILTMMLGKIFNIMLGSILTQPSVLNGEKKLGEGGHDSR